MKLYRLREELLLKTGWNYQGGDFWFPSEEAAAHYVGTMCDEAGQPFREASDPDHQRVWITGDEGKNRDVLDSFDVAIPTTAADLAHLFNVVIQSAGDRVGIDEGDTFLGERF